MNEDETKPPPKDVIADHFEELKQIEIQGYEPAIRKARNTLFAVAGIFLVSEVVTALATDIPFSPLLIGIIAVECGLFVALGFWANTKPFAAISIGLILFIGLWIFAIVASGFKAAYGGIIIRIVVISYLVKALKDAKAWEEVKRRR